MGCTIFRAVIAALTMTLFQAANSGVIAQTLIEPNSKSRPPQSSGVTKPHPAARTKRSAFGAGFAPIPGTDTCVKIGGFVNVDGTTNHGR
jgi:hypothetical protein